MRNPDKAESRVCVFTRELAKSLRYSPYRLTDESKKDGMSTPSPRPYLSYQTLMFILSSHLLFTPNVER